MKAFPEYHKENTEWRVHFYFNEIWADIPHYQILAREWIDANVEGLESKDWRFSSYSIHPYLAFLREEDALLCLLAFK